ncbi:beta strand repeat-containing protein [Luteolibacter sp. Populi]|uniref:beta strand repeat-containing protein n=1 Tax=Luteolibacter sp. Populi TaxID=3230487 RepID=UPI003464EF1F
MIHLHTSGGRAALLAAAASLSVITAASAAIKTWDGAGADDNWQTGQNWNADAAPLPEDQLVFAGTVRPVPSNNFAAATAFNGISVSGNAAAFTLSGNAISLTRPIAAGSVNVSGGTVINSSPNLLTVALPAALSAGKQSITSPAGGGGINFTGAFSHSPNSSVVFTRSGGHINFNGSGLANDASGILGGWAIIGDDWATLNGSGNVVAYTGYTPITAGAIATGPNLNYRLTDETGDITAATGTTINTLQAKISANRNLNITGQFRLMPNGGIYRLGTSTAGILGIQGTGSTLTADGGGAIHLWDATTSAANFAATSNNLRVDSVITNDGASPVSVNIMGYVQMGTATLGANTYSGGTFINQGRAQASNPASFGIGPVTVYPGGQAFTNSGNPFANAFNVSGNGTTETNSAVNDGPGAIRLGTGATISGTVTYSGATRLTTNSAGAGGTFSGRITGSGALQVGGFGGSPAIMNLSNAGAPNNWDGPLTISSLSTSRVFTLRLGASGQIPDTGSVTLTGVGAATSTFELNGFNETIGALNSATSPLLVVSNMASSTSSTLTVGADNANGDFGGTLQDKNLEPASTFNLVKTGSGTQILRGLSSYFGTTTVNGGTLECVGSFFALGDVTVNTGGTLAANDVITGNVVLAGGTLRPSLVDFGQLQLSGNLSLGAGSILDLNTASLPGEPIMVTGNVTPTGGAGSVTVNLSGTEPSVGQHLLITYEGAGPIGGLGAAAFVLGQKPPRMVATIIEDIPGQALLLNVTASGISARWTGALGSEWSTATLPAPKNWVLSTSPGTTTDFLANNAVIFNDSATGNTVDISVADVPASAITFDNTDDDYTLTGSKGIIGAGILTKTGDGKLTVTNPNGYTGGTVITAGTVEVGNGGSLGTNQVHNDTLLVINRSDDSTFAPVIEGPGKLNLIGTGTTTLAGASFYSGDTLVAAGTARVATSGSLGTGGPVQVLAGAAVDLGGNPVNTHNFGGKQFFISGNGPTGTGALVHSGTVGQLNAYQAVALEADASVGGTARFDIRGGTPVLDLNGHTLRKRGTNQFTLVGATVEDGGTIIVEQGLFAIETTGTTNGSGSVIIEPGAYGGFYQNVPPVDGGVTWPYTLREGAAIGNAGAGLATIPAPIILEGNALLVGFNASAPDPTFNRPLTLTGDITESGGSFGLTKNGISVVNFSGTANSYTGPTVVNAGSLIVDGSLTASPVTLAAGATLGGIGTLGGTVAANGIVSPAMAVTGTLATGAVTLGATASLAVQVDSGTLVSDTLAVSGALHLGGATLTLTDLGAAVLPADTKFTIATYTGGISGTFANAADGAVLTVGLNKFKVDYDDPAIGGTAVTLTVSAGTAYDAWATLKGLTIGNSGKLEDPDHDGLENILEFAFNGVPLAAARDGKTRAVIADVDAGAPVENAFTLTFPVRNGAAFSGPGDLITGPTDNLVYAVRGSLDLDEFTTLTITEVTPALSDDMPDLTPGWSYRTFRLPGTPGSPNPKAFLQIAVTEAQ